MNKDVKKPIEANSKVDTTKQKQREYSPVNNICCFLIIIILVTVIYFEDAFRIRIIQVKRSQVGTDQSRLRYFINTLGCKIPNVDPYDDEMGDYIRESKKKICDRGKPALFESNITSLYIVSSSVKYYAEDIDKLHCC